jgi:Protein of unknown function (DUF3826)
MTMKTIKQAADDVGWRLSIASLAAVLAFLSCASPALTAKERKDKPALSAEETEAAYTQSIEKRAAGILADLNLKDEAKAARVRQILLAQYRALRDWHGTNDVPLKKAGPDERQRINGSLKSLHDQFLHSLGAELSDQQIEQVKDKLTYNKVKVTYDAYAEIVPKLTESEKKQIMEYLKQAREEAIDAGSSEEKSAIFKKYKGKINNYLDQQGYDVKQAYKDWGAKQKSKTSVP